MTRTRVLTRAAVLGALLSLGACGGGSNGPTPLPPTPPPTPAAAVSAAGGGALGSHPSLDGRFGFALETPMRVTETGGGTADWNFARFQTFRANREVERNELGSDVIRAAGYGRISASSNQVVTAVFRMNSSDFD